MGTNLTIEYYLHFRMYVNSNGSAREMLVSEYVFLNKLSGIKKTF